MKRKSIAFLLALTIATLGMSACGNNSEQEISSEPTESVTETEQVSESTEADTTATETNDKIVESEGWPDYKKTMDYYVENGILSERRAYFMNPDVYGTELAGMAAMDVDTGTGSPDAGIYIKQLKTTTTKGFPMEAYWYTETNTVQYVYCDEASPAGGWYVGATDTMCYLMDNGSCTNSLDMTRQERIELLGEPSLTPEEVIYELSNGTIDYMKRLILKTTGGYDIQAFWNMEDNTVQYVYPGDISPYGDRSSFVRSADALALQGKYSGTRQEKVAILGEPSMTDEEVIAALSEQ